MFMLYIYTYIIRLINITLSLPRGDIHVAMYILITVIFWYLSLSALLTILINFNKIKYMITVIKVSTEFVKSNISIVMVPFILFTLVVVIMSLWVYSSMYLFYHSYIYIA